MPLTPVVTCIGIGFQRGTHTRWQLVANAATGASTLTDIGASFAIVTGGVLHIAVPPNGGPHGSGSWTRFQVRSSSGSPA